MTFPSAEEIGVLARAADVVEVVEVVGNSARGAECGDKRVRSDKTSRIMIPLG